MLSRSASRLAVSLMPCDLILGHVKSNIWCLSPSCHWWWSGIVQCSMHAASKRLLHWDVHKCLSSAPQYIDFYPRNVWMELFLWFASKMLTCFSLTFNFIVAERRVLECTPCLCCCCVFSQLHDFWRLDYWEDDLRRRRRFVRNSFGSTHADVSLKALDDYGAWHCAWSIPALCIDST